MRLFTAIELPDAARAAVAAQAGRMAARAGAAADPIRWVRPEHLHLTLVFLGEIAADPAAAAAAAMADPVDLPAFTMALGRIGVFPDRGAPKVLWLGVVEGGASVLRLHGEVAERLARCGCPVPAGPFHPHLTLGRWKRSRPRDRAILAAGSGETVATVDVAGVALLESRLTSTGPEYRLVSRASLRSGTLG